MLYSYSFEQNSEWTREYPGQEEILAYLRSVAAKYGLYNHIRFNTTVESAHWDDESKKWKTTLTTAAGSKDAEFNREYEITTDFLVSGMGQLNVPKYPEDIPGLKDFQGKVMHSARWDWSYDLVGKKIAVIGNGKLEASIYVTGTTLIHESLRSAMLTFIYPGATAAQIIPEIAKVAEHVTVFQRTPNWVIPREDAPVSSFYRNLYKYVPPLRWRKRAFQM